MLEEKTRWIEFSPDCRPAFGPLRQNAMLLYLLLSLGRISRAANASKGALEPPADEAFLGYSISELSSVVRGFESPPWTPPGQYYSSAHPCRLESFMLSSLADGVRGLELGSVPLI